MAAVRPLRLDRRTGAGRTAALASRRRALLFALALVPTALSGCEDPSNRSLGRGDRLLATGRLEEAIAEYKLALRQAGESPEVTLRLGQAYAASGDVDETLRYLGALLAADSSYRYQVAAELGSVARDALARGARENMARALAPLEAWSIGLIPLDLQLALARYHRADGDYASALSLYLAVLADTSDLAPDVYYEIGRAYEELGGCRESVALYEAFLEEARRGSPETAGARWRLGNCLVTLADEEWSAGRPASALEKLERMIEIGEPQTLLDRAHFRRGELYLALGDPDAALAAYREVLRLNPNRSAPLVQQAEQRIRQIRFGHE